MKSSLVVLFILAAIALAGCARAEPTPDAVALEATVAQRIFTTLTASAPTATTIPPAASTPTSTSSAMPTEAPATPTATIEPPTDIPVPSTPTATSVPETPTPEGPRAVVQAASMNVRSGPGTAYPIVATATQGQAFAVTGRSNDGTWLEVDLTNGQVGWIAAALVETNVTTDQIGLAATIPTAPAPLSIPIPTPIVNDAVFLPPVDPNVVPLYNAFDLNPQNGVVEIQSAKYPPRTDFGCSGGFFLPGTPDNHFAWDYGTGNCSKHLVDTLVYGMSVGFQGEVLDVSFDSPRYPIRVDYGKIRCTDGRVRSITIQYAHSLPRVKMGDRVDSNTAIASLENVSVEVEIQVFGDGRNIDPRLIGLNLP